MKKQSWVGVVVSLLFLATIAIAATYPIQTGRMNQGVGWAVTASDDDVDASAELLTELDTTFVQMAAAAQIYAVSSAAGDTTQTLYVSGISNAGKSIVQSWTLTGTTPVAASTKTFDYVNQTWVSAECAGTVSVSTYLATPALVNSIEIGSLKGDIGQHFNGEKSTYVQKWWATSTATANTSVLLELRWYPDDADCLDPTDGFTVLDKIFLAGTIYSSPARPLGDPGRGLRLPAGGWLAVYGTGGAADQEVSVTVIGQDASR